MDTRVLISGAGIAGPVLAHQLVRAGFRPTIVERAPALRPGGNGVDLRDGSLRVIERMGLLPAVADAANDVSGLRFLNRAGRPVARVDLRAIADSTGADGLEIPRGALTQILYDATKDDVEYLFGDSIQELTDDGAGVDIRLGMSTRRFDLVVGADGAHSRVRKLVFGAEEQFAHSLGHCFAYAAADPALATERWTTLYNLPGRSVVVDRPGNRNRAAVTFAFRHDDPLAAARLDIDAQKELIAQTFADVTVADVPALVDGALADPNFYFDALSQVRMPSWSRGRVTLIGDAAACASPVSGAGAHLAISAAYRLAGELTISPTDHAPWSTATGDARGTGDTGSAGGSGGSGGSSECGYAAAFRRYEEGHRPLVERTQKNLFLGTVVPGTRAGILARNTFARLPGVRLLTGLERRLRTPDPALPDYPALTPQEI